MWLPKSLTLQGEVTKYMRVSQSPFYNHKFLRTFFLLTICRNRLFQIFAFLILSEANNRHLYRCLAPNISTRGLSDHITIAISLGIYGTMNTLLKQKGVSMDFSFLGLLWQCILGAPTLKSKSVSVKFLCSAEDRYWTVVTIILQWGNKALGELKDQQWQRLASAVCLQANVLKTMCSYIRCGFRGKRKWIHSTENRFQRNSS